MTIRSLGRKKSNFPASTTVLSGGYFDFFANGVNYKITFSDLVAMLGATGTLEQDGAITGAPVLDGVLTTYKIRNLEDGPGILMSISPENGITVEQNFTADTDGIPVLTDTAEVSPIIRSILEGDNITVALVGDAIEISTNLVPLDNRVIVKSATQLTGTLDSTKEYFLDGIIDMAGFSIEVPQGGLTLSGYNFDLSKLISSEASYTMFTSPAAGSGNLLGRDYAIEVTGASSKVYDIVSDTGNEAVEFARVNYNDCTSLGTIDNYRQGLESGSGRFGGQPSLTLKGVWSGGYRITTSIVRSIDNAMTEPLFKAGAGFTMASRFLTDLNCDLGTLAPFADFAPANFLNSSLLQIHATRIVRNGVADPEDATILPNILASDLESDFQDNVGISNTFPGGTSTISSETATTIAVIGTFVDLAGTWTASDLQHFTAPANGQLRHDGDTPHEYNVSGSLVVVGPANDVVTLKLVKYDASATSFVDVASISRQINSLIGARDVAIVTAIASVDLDVNDYIKLQIANETSTGNLTAELDSFFKVAAR